MKAIRVMLFAGLLGGLAALPALADHHMVSSCNDCRSGHRLFGRRGDCGPCEEKACVSKAAKVKTKKTIYECKSEDFCLPGHPSRCFTPLSHGCKDDCCTCNQCGTCDHCRRAACDKDQACQACEHKARSKKVLIKRIKTEEKDSHVCVVEKRPCAVIIQDCAPRTSPRRAPACETVIIHEAPGKAVELAPMPAEKTKPR